MKETINPLTWRFDLVGEGSGPTPTPTEYTAGDWIDITNHEISIDTTVVATQTDLQNAAYTAWSWIDITDHEISIDTDTVATKNDIPTVNVNAFDASSEAQDALDRYKEWNTPVLVSNGCTYTLESDVNSKLTFVGEMSQENQYSSTYIKQNAIIITYSGDTVTDVALDTKVVWWSYLRLGQSYNVPYIPTLDWEPTTKKYVDVYGPSIPVYVTHWSITGTKTLYVFEQGTYKISLTWTRAWITNRTITISADWTTVATYTAAYSGLVSITTTVTASTNIVITLDTDLTLSDIVIDKIIVQQWIITDNIS